MKIGIVSGYFDPIHNGHIEYLKIAKGLCDKLIVILNNDFQAKLKKGNPFMEENVRKEVLEAIRYVDEVVLSVDKERNVCETLKIIRKKYPNDELNFINGGDQNQETIPEFDTCKGNNIEMIDDAGEKVNSSRNYYNK